MQIDARSRVDFDVASMPPLEKFEPFDFENVQNGSLAWHESALMNFLGYRGRKSFRKAVKRAMQACLAINIDPGRDFLMQPSGDYKFTRHACFLIAMNADSKKQQVATAQAYFVTIANIIHDHIEQAKSIDRIVIRDEIADGMKALSETAKQHGVAHYGRFMDAGYRGMYNMSLDELTRAKGVPLGEKLIDRMDRTELAANLFRVTQTDEKIRKDQVAGQDALEATAHKVGARVRDAMLDLTGNAPEALPIAEPIQDAKRRLRAADRRLQEFDRQPKLTRVLGTLPEPSDPPDAGYTVEPEDGSDED